MSTAKVCMDTGTGDSGMLTYDDRVSTTVPANTKPAWRNHRAGPCTPTTGETETS